MEVPAEAGGLATAAAPPPAGQRTGARPARRGCSSSGDGDGGVVGVGGAACREGIFVRVAWRGGRCERGGVGRVVEMRVVEARLQGGRDRRRWAGACACALRGATEPLTSADDDDDDATTGARCCCRAAALLEPAAAALTRMLPSIILVARGVGRRARGRIARVGGERGKTPQEGGG